MVPEPKLEKKNQFVKKIIVEERNIFILKPGPQKEKKIYHFILPLLRTNQVF